MFSISCVMTREASLRLLHEVSTLQVLPCDWLLYPVLQFGGLIVYDGMHLKVIMFKLLPSYSPGSVKLFEVVEPTNYQAQQHFVLAILQIGHLQNKDPWQGFADVVCIGITWESCWSAASESIVKSESQKLNLAAGGNVADVRAWQGRKMNLNSMA